MRKICGKYVETSFHFHASRNAVRTHRPDSWNRQLGQTDRLADRQRKNRTDIVKHLANVWTEQLLG